MSQNAAEVKEAVKVYKWDGTAVKNALDDAVKEVMTNKLPYKENFGLKDGRLVICGVAVGVAMFALLWDFLYPFPLSRPVLIGCVTTYFILMGILTLYTTFKVGLTQPEIFRETKKQTYFVPGERNIRGSDAEGPRRPGPRLDLGGLLQHEEVR